MDTFTFHTCICTHQHLVAPAGSYCENCNGLVPEYNPIAAQPAPVSRFTDEHFEALEDHHRPQRSANSRKRRRISTLRPILRDRSPQIRVQF